MSRKDSRLFLDESLFIGEGSFSRTYIHPDDENLCVKIPREDVSKKEGSRKREIKYLKSLKKRGKSFEMLYKYHYDVSTNLGKGHIYDLVRDYNGDISKRIGYYLNLGDDMLCSEIVRHIDHLRRYLLREYILFTDLKEDNILLQKVSPTKTKLIIIDGVDYNNRIPVLEYFPAIGRKRQIRKWNKFRDKMIREFPCLGEKMKKFSEEN